MKQIRNALTVLVILSLILVSAPVQAQSGAQTLQTCSQVDEAALQDELNTVTQAIFAQALTEIDLAAIVDAEWQRLGIDATIDTAVDQAAARVRGQEALWETFLSSWSAQKAEELTEAVAQATFDSEAFHLAVDSLANAVADQLAAEIAVLSAESASAAFYCLQTFIAGNYAGVLVSRFEQQVQAAAASVEVDGASAVDSNILTVLNQHRPLLGGVGVIIAAQIARRVVVNIGRQIARRVAGRITGRVLGRIGTNVIPLAGWLVGTGLIAYDIYASRDGALPQIQAQLKEPEVKAAIRAELVTAMTPEFRREAPQIARDVANELFGQWREVRRTIRQVLELAEQDPAFQTLLSGLESDSDLAHLVDLVAVARPALGEENFQQALTDGSLERLLHQSPALLPILAATQSVDATLAWAALAGEQLSAVVQSELYKHVAPAQLNRTLLDNLLAVGNPSVIQKLALLEPATIETLLTISTGNLNLLAGQLSADQLQVVATYLPALTQEQRNQLISRVASNPELITLLEGESVRQRLVAGDDVDATLTFLASPRTLDRLWRDIPAVLSGQVGIGLFVDKYGAGQSSLITLGLVLLLLIGVRLLYAFVLWLINPVTGLWRR